MERAERGSPRSGCYGYVDVSEDYLLAVWPVAFEQLLCDQTTGRNIFWATDDYAAMGDGYGWHDPIVPSRVTGGHGHVVMPRILKSKELQTLRVKGRGEVFTPAWMCNHQNNLVDEAWFGRKDVFNRETASGGQRSWDVSAGRVAFPEGKSWRDYVAEERLEITCGEAPYLVSRYDVATGEPIELSRRIGLLDRKLRIVSENTAAPTEWLRWAHVALRSVYGFEWQGDNLLIARENVLTSFIDYYVAKFGRLPQGRSVFFAAYAISWNIWQMDGLRGVVPGSCHPEKDLFGQDSAPCRGCAEGNIRLHNGTYCEISDWRAGKPPKKRIRFIDINKNA